MSVLSSMETMHVARADQTYLSIVEWIVSPGKFDVLGSAFAKRIFLADVQIETVIRIDAGVQPFRRFLVRRAIGGGHPLPRLFTPVSTARR